VWSWQPGAKGSKGGSTTAKETLPLPDKPSIAVLPFDNMSGDPEQEYFADGIAEDLITALSRFPWLFVIARNSSFTYKGRSVDVKQVGRDLGVRYVVEGSVRRSDTRLRVAAQLIDATTGHHVWAERYDRPVGDLFDLQDDITEMITGVLVPALGSAERERASRKLRPSLDAWEMYQRGLLHYYRPYSHDDHAEARRLFDRAIELDPDFADAHAIVGLMGVYAVNSGQSSYSSSPQETLAEAARAARRAVQLEDNNALAHIALGRALDLMGDLETGIAECETAVRLNPNLAVAHHELGFVLVHAGRSAEALSCFDKAIRLSPNDPSRWNFFLLKGATQSHLGEHESAIGNLKTAARLRPTSFWPHLFFAVALVGLGRMDEARAAIQEALSRNPDITLTIISQIRQNRHSEYIDKILDQLQKAGLPE
jgi:TolB-like protein